jgi:translation initiation factor IF-1
MENIVLLHCKDEVVHAVQGINVYCKNQMKYKKTLCGKMHFPNIRVGGTYTGVLLSP